MPSSELTPLLFLGLMLVLFYMFVVRPGRRQQRQTLDFQSELKPGDRVVISSGIFGTIDSIEDNRVHLEIAPGTVIEVAKQVVVRRAEDLAQSEAEAPGDDSATGPSAG